MVGTVTEYLSKMTTGMFHYVVIKIPSFSLSQLVLTVSSMCRSMYEEEIGVCVVLFFFKCNGKDATNIGIWTIEKQYVVHKKCKYFDDVSFRWVFFRIKNLVTS